MTEPKPRVIIGRTEKYTMPTIKAGGCFARSEVDYSMAGGTAKFSLSGRIRTTDALADADLKEIKAIMDRWLAVDGYTIEWEEAK